ncbi:MAG: tetratricopeptide repeat protein [Sandaracinaceae bacterium]|nr:tetratricopeptide repeat protein [Sandaracinaceae bacterium]
MTSPRLCGTAQRQMGALGDVRRYRQAMRALGRGELERAKTLMPEGIDGAVPGSPVSVEIVAYAHARLFADLDDDARAQAAVSADFLRGEVARLDARLSHPSRDLPSNARMRIARAHAAALLEEHALVEPLYTTAISEIASAWGEDHLEIASYLDDYATWLLSRGRSAEALEAIARARTIHERSGHRYEELG